MDNQRNGGGSAMELLKKISYGYKVQGGVYNVRIS